jgi:hypothetical protein
LAPLGRSATGAHAEGVEARMGMLAASKARVRVALNNMILLAAAALAGCPRETPPESPARERSVDSPEEAGRDVKKSLDKSSKPLEPPGDDVNDEPDER